MIFSDLFYLQLAAGTAVGQLHSIRSTTTRLVFVHIKQTNGRDVPAVYPLVLARYIYISFLSVYL